jgi:hypothetical protein
MCALARGRGLAHDLSPVILPSQGIVCVAELILKYGIYSVNQHLHQHLHFFAKRHADDSAKKNPLKMVLRHTGKA